ncbi:MAG: hypothetical protein B7Z81_00745, partial [Acidocella sp. 20-61-6]
MHDGLCITTNTPPPHAPRLVIDLRCLQDPDTATRGIGSHARRIVESAPEPFVGLFDPKFPPLPIDITGRAALLSPHAYLPDLAPGAVFLNPAPMGKNPLALARLLLDPHITKAAVVYDFIPFDDAKSYLDTPKARLEYATALAWLRRYNVFLPISAATQARLVELLGPVNAVVTGVALPGWMTDVQTAAPRHIFMAGGADARKNPDVLARAHASCATLRKIPLVISGGCNPAQEARLHAITDVTFTGAVKPADLRRLFAQAYCVVAPSYAEGFSLPVIEAMAAGTPAVVSDILAHRELVDDAALRFAPDDEASLAVILEEIVTNPARRAAVVAAQGLVLARFSAEAVSQRVWGALRPRAPAVLRGEKPELAIMTPLPPVKSGVADHSAALVAALQPLTRLRVFSQGALSPLAHLRRRSGRVLSVLGNSPHHTRAYELAVTYGSAVLCHDARLLGLVSAGGLRAAAAIAGQELKRPVAEAEILAWSADETQREASFLGEIAAAAKPLIFHSQQPANLVQARFGAAAKYLPFAIYRDAPAHITHTMRQTARQALGIEDTMKIIASFGFIAPQKGIETALHSFARMRMNSACKLVFVGEATLHVAT